MQNEVKNNGFVFHKNSDEKQSISVLDNNNTLVSQ